MWSRIFITSQILFATQGNHNVIMFVDIRTCYIKTWFHHLSRVCFKYKYWHKALTFPVRALFMYYLYYTLCKLEQYLIHRSLHRSNWINWLSCHMQSCRLFPGWHFVLERKCDRNQFPSVKNLSERREKDDNYKVHNK